MVVMKYAQSTLRSRAISLNKVMEVRDMQKWIVKETVVLYKYVKAETKEEAMYIACSTRADHQVDKSVTVIRDKN